MNKKIIVGIVVALIVIIVIIAVFFLLPKENNSSNNGIFSNDGNSISNEEISKYELETDTIWINKPLNITYNIPKQISDSMLNGSSSFTYMHGSSFSYYSGYKIYVDKSLENNKDLKNLASNIIKEKNSDKYKLVYQFGSKFLTEFKNDKTENVKIGNIETIYFESEEIKTSSVVGNELKVRIIGYSFEYNNQYISVYGELLIEEESKQENLKQMLQYIVNSIKNYNGETLEQLGGNAKNYYDDGFTNNTYNTTASTFITMNNYSIHSRNGILASTRSRSRGFCFELAQNNINFKNGSIQDLTNAISTTKYSKHDFEWYEEAYDSNSKTHSTLYDVLKEDNIKINDIDIHKYILKVYYNTGKTAGKIVAVYLIQVDGQTYLCQYSLNDSIYNAQKLGEMSEEQIQTIISQTEIIADSMILTIRRLDKNFQSMDSLEQYRETNKYITRYS